MHSKAVREKVKQDYNEIAGEFSASRQNSWSEFEDFKPYLRDGMKVLDLGCGNGRLLDFLKPWKVNYLGVDQSEVLIRHAQKNHPGERFEVRDMADLVDFKGEWDAIFMVASFHHLSHADQSRVLKWVHRHLKPGGHLFMTNWNLFQGRFWKAWLRAFFWPNFGFRGLLIPWNKGVKRYYYAFTPLGLYALLRKAGFKVLLSKSGRNFIHIAQA